MPGYPVRPIRALLDYPDNAVGNAEQNNEACQHDQRGLLHVCVTHDALVSFQQSAVGVLPASAQRAWDSTR